MCVWGSDLCVYNQGVPAYSYRFAVKRGGEKVTQTYLVTNPLEDSAKHYLENKSRIRLQAKYTAENSHKKV